MLIKLDDLSHPETRALLALHIADLQRKSPAESCYVLDLTALQQPAISMYTAWHGPDLLGCGALKELSPTAGEIKSMRTAAAHLRKGVARALVQHIIREARRRGYVWLSLETGTDGSFTAAREFYAGQGFEVCEAFGDYVPRAGTCFMRLRLG
ncbi:GNAT family N-acetyltransferase [Aspergillus aculeatinus CBS 121060]|uniref:GNAT family acetyltransferase n=1 Tax=Aspergillus aculeatinus CBS 121060 TaxID=1448322 RepID=A0ACD1GW73_9EURO|nr:putative GNAT family acetyltransferase [Aspergillus aculeatinus CBS 121060]RAH65715.1 putative GNAT family acetyltransferase [Aspergillus aculeatinus CBS 121060]